MIPTLIDLIGFAATLFTLLLLARVVISWVQPNLSNPLVSLLHQVTEPVLRPVRELLPPVGGMDFSPLIVLIAVQVLEQLLVSILYRLA